MPHRVSLALALAPLLACSSGSNESSAGGPCANTSASLDAYVAGLSRLGDAGAIDFAIVDADPAPPGRGTNRWVVQLRDANLAPLPGATLTRASGWMPDHGHGSGSMPAIATDANGRSTIEGLELVMPGVWTISLKATKDATEDATAFSFCIDG